MKKIWQFQQQLLRLTVALSGAALLALAAALISAPALAGEPAQPHPQAEERLVLAFYYAWYDENTWTPEKVPDFPQQPYVSRDRGVMARHIEQAQQAGIDGFVVAWYGPSGQWNQTEANLAALLEEAAARNFRIGILFESTSPFFAGVEDATAAMAHALSVHAQHPAYLRVGGRPVVFVWRPHIWSVDTWRGIRQRTDPAGNALWLAEGVDLAFQAVFDGHFLYSNTWNPPTDLDYTNQKFAGGVARASEQYGIRKYWVATVMPGYDDTRTGRGNAFRRDRENGGYYERSWQSAIGSNPDWVVITSFNEWPEGTYIEPSDAYGDRFLGLTSAWSARFKAGQTAAPGQPAAVATAPAVAPPPVPTATPIPPPREPTGFVTAYLLNLRTGPDTTFPVLAQMPEGAALPLLGQDPAYPRWWQVRFGELTGWAHGDYLALAGPLEAVPEVVAPPLPPPAEPARAQAPGADLQSRGLNLPDWLLRAALGPDAEPSATADRQNSSQE